MESSTIQPNQILINKPPCIRLIIPEEVVMQPRLTVGILVLQAEQEGAQQKSGTVKITRNLLLLRAILLMSMMGFC